MFVNVYAKKKLITDFPQIVKPIYLCELYSTSIDVTYR